MSNDTMARKRRVIRKVKSTKKAPAADTGNPLVHAGSDRMRYMHKAQLTQQIRSQAASSRYTLCASYGCDDGCARIESEYCYGLFHIHCAVARGDIDTLAQLISEGHDVNSRNENGDTPLILAAILGDMRIIDMLLEAGADVNAVDRHGETALMTAVMSGHHATARRLLEVGADVYAPSNHLGLNAMALAVLHSQQDMVAMLEAAGSCIARGLPLDVDGSVRDDNFEPPQPLTSTRERMLRDGYLELTSACTNLEAPFVDIASLEEDIAALAVGYPPVAHTTMPAPSVASALQLAPPAPAPSVATAVTQAVFGETRRSCGGVGTQGRPSASVDAVTVAVSHRAKTSATELTITMAADDVPRSAGNTAPETALEANDVEANAVAACAFAYTAQVSDTADAAMSVVTGTDEWEIVSPALSEGDIDSILDALARVELVTGRGGRETELQEESAEDGSSGASSPTVARISAKDETDDREERVWVAAAEGFDVEVRESAPVSEVDRQVQRGSEGVGVSGQAELTQAASTTPNATMSQQGEIEVEVDEQTASEDDGSGLSSDEDIVFVSDDDNRDDSDPEDTTHGATPTTTNTLKRPVLPVARRGTVSGGTTVTVGYPSTSAVSLDTALLVAVEQGNLTQVQLLLDNKASPHARNALRQDPLMLALARGHTHVWQHLLAMPTYTSTCACDRAGKDVLMYALEQDALDVIRHVLDNLAAGEPRARRVDATLIAAAALGNVPVVQLLLDAGGSLAAVNACGETALICAVRGRHHHVAEMLLTAGASAAAVDVDGHDALESAFEQGDHGMVQLLLEHNAMLVGKRRGGKEALLRACIRVDGALLQHLLGAAEGEEDSTYSNTGE